MPVINLSPTRQQERHTMEINEIGLVTDVDTQQVIVIAKLLVNITRPSFVVWTRYAVNRSRLGPVVPIYAYRFLL